MLAKKNEDPFDDKDWIYKQNNHRLQPVVVLFIGAIKI
jgi:hypothetical protein